MKVNSLCLDNFRNYNHFFIEFDRDINILIGSNGQGKTNLIEAIYLLSVGKSFKTHINKTTSKKILSRKKKLHNVA